MLGDWLAHLDELHVSPRVGWLSLDAGDNDLVRMLTHMTAALHGAGLEIDTGILESVRPGSATAALTALVNDVALAGELMPGDRWVLVLDDYQVIEAVEVHEAVTFLLDHLSDQLHLVMATRSDPPLPLARLRARGQLTEVRAADLRFTAAEAQDFLNRAMGLDLSPADVDALDERTEGWVAGLQLAALSLRGMPGAGESAAFIEAFTGSNRFVIDYLADEVLARQPPEIRDFLLRTAVLERLSGPLCDSVTGRADGTRTLEELERGNLFVVPLDSERSWYRYHHLFGDALHARLLAEHPDEVPDLHQRASAHYASLGLVPEAVRHALAADDFDRAARLIEEAVPEVTRTRQDGLLLSWARALPDPVVRRSPVLCIVSGWSFLMAGDLDALESRLDDSEAALAEGARDPHLAANLGGHRPAANRPGDDLGLPRFVGPGAWRCRGNCAPCTSRARAGRSRRPFPARSWGRVPRAGGLGGRRSPGGAGDLLRGDAQPARRWEPGRRARRHGEPRGHVGGLGQAEPRPPAVRAEPADGHEAR